MGEVYFILSQIEDERERITWENKIDNKLRSYVEDVVNANKKGKTPSDKKINEILKDIKTVEKIILT
jgi:ribosomal protein L17